MPRRSLMPILLFSAITLSRAAKVPTAVLENTKDVPNLNDRSVVSELDRLLSSLFLNPVSSLTKQQEPHKQRTGDTRTPSRSQNPLSESNKFPNQENQFGNQQQFVHTPEQLKLSGLSNTIENSDQFTYQAPFQSEQGNLQNEKEFVNEPQQIQNETQVSSEYPQNDSYFQPQTYSTTEQGYSRHRDQSSVLEQTTSRRSQFQNHKRPPNNGRFTDDQQHHSQKSQHHRQSDEPSLVSGRLVVVPTTTVPDGIVVFEDAPLETPTQRQCVQDCLSTSEYRPVCGTNNVTYFNPSKFTCARKCGEHVFVRKEGRCSPDGP